jgi:hypothetical protein
MLVQFQLHELLVSVMNRQTTNLLSLQSIQTLLQLSQGLNQSLQLIFLRVKLVLNDYFGIKLNNSRVTVVFLYL